MYHTFYYNKHFCFILNFSLRNEKFFGRHLRKKILEENKILQVTLGVARCHWPGSLLYSYGVAPTILWTRLGTVWLRGAGPVGRWWGKWAQSPLAESTGGSGSGDSGSGGGRKLISPPSGCHPGSSTAQADIALKWQRTQSQRKNSLPMVCNMSELGHLRYLVNWGSYEPQNERITVSLAVIWNTKAQGARGS